MNGVYKNRPNATSDASHYTVEFTAKDGEGSSFTVKIRADILGYDVIGTDKNADEPYKEEYPDYGHFGKITYTILKIPESMLRTETE